MKFWKKAAIAGAGVAAAGIGAGVVIIDGNSHLTISEHELIFPDLPDAFDGFRFVQISDLHNASFGKDQKKLLTLIDSLDVSAVLITGDLMDRRRTETDVDMLPALTLLKELSARFPTIRVDGNHETIGKAAPRFRFLADRTGAQNITGRAITLHKNGDRLVLVGVPDIAFFEYDEDAWRQMMRELYTPHDREFCIALSHRPQYFEDYTKIGFPLVLCGHAHGGQVRLPLVGGLFAPEQGVLPKFTAGLHQDGDTTMLVSRGLGNSGFPIRFGNRPELIAVTLKK